jgi:uncharacterized phiE125 gp8 family phage protein
MATVQTSAPVVEPVSLLDVKAHLRIDTADEDSLLQSLIMTARLHIEVALGLALITQTWSCYFDQWPSTQEPRAATLHRPPSLDALIIPISPIKSIDAIRVYADDGTFIALPLTGFLMDVVSRRARVVRRFATALPAPGRKLNGIEVAVTAGFGATSADIPAPIRQAHLLLVAHWYEHRDPAEIGTPEARVPAAVSSLLAPWAPVRL